MFPMISGGALVILLDSDPIEDTTEPAPSVPDLLSGCRKEGRLNFLAPFSSFTSSGGMFPMISGGGLVIFLDSDPTEDATEPAPSVPDLLRERRKEGRLDFLAPFSSFIISGGRLVGILDSDPATEDTTEPAPSSVPGLNHPCFLGFFKFTSIFFRFSSFGTVFLFLALPAAAEEFPVYNEKGHAGK